MSVASVAVEKKTITTFTMIGLPRRRDGVVLRPREARRPEFTVKTASIVTMYPGATAAEVELEVTDPIEIALQEMPQLKQIESSSRGRGCRSSRSTFSPEYTPRTNCRRCGMSCARKSATFARACLRPPSTPDVGDDFGDVYGFLLAVVSDGFSYAQLEQHVDAVKKELSLVPGVARGSNCGACRHGMRLSRSLAGSALAAGSDDGGHAAHAQRSEHVVTDSGGLSLGKERLRIEVTGEFTIARRHRRRDDPRPLSVQSQQNSGELIRVRDIATVMRGYVEPPMSMMRFNGQPAIGVAISNRSGVSTSSRSGRRSTRGCDE